MAKDTRLSDLVRVFDRVDANERTVIEKLIVETVELEKHMDELKRMPFIVQHPTKPYLQKATPAARQYKECSQSYMNAIRILCGVLRQNGIDEQNELLKRLEEFE